MPRVTPHSIWRIPKTEIKRLKGEQNGTTLSEKKVTNRHEQTDPMLEEAQKEHDRIIFIESDSIINENEMQEILAKLGPRGIFDESHHSRLTDFIEFFDLESNQYLDTELRGLCEDTCELLDMIYVWAEASRLSFESDKSRAKLHQLIQLNELHEQSEDLKSSESGLKWRKHQEQKFANEYQDLKHMTWQQYASYRQAIRARLSL